jgi:MoaA/NifB/PqqE/SkfB family radical SAM enzyme
MASRKLAAMSGYFKYVLPKGIQQKMLSIFIQRYLNLLANTRDKEEFFERFDEILGGLSINAGASESGNAVEVVRKVLHGEYLAALIRKRFSPEELETLQAGPLLERLGNPYAQLIQLLIQRRLSKSSRDKLAEIFFCRWIMENKRDRLEKEGFKAPWFFVVSPLRVCNLKCVGCYANAGGGTQIPYPVLDRIINEAKDLGIRFITISGGEPFFYKDREANKTILDLFREHDDIYYLVYTNGIPLVGEKGPDETRLSPAGQKRIEEGRKIARNVLGAKNVGEILGKIGNVAPAVSQEGFQEETDDRRGEGVYEAVVRARENLSYHGVLQGFSVTVTHHNWHLVSGEAFIQDMVEKGVSFGWYFQYIPTGKDPDVSFMAAPGERDQFRKRVWSLRARYPIFIGDFRDDGPWVGSCISGGRKYFHINYEGAVEPCVFAQFHVVNIISEYEKKENRGINVLRETIQSPFFKEIRRRQLQFKNDLAPCMIIDHPQMLRDLVAKFGAKPREGEGEIITRPDIVRFLDSYAEEYERVTRPEFEKMLRGEHNTENVKLDEVMRHHRWSNKRRVELENKGDM